METFCVLPWVGREITWDFRETHCCLLPPSYDIEQIKLEMLQGKQPNACQKCWTLEAQNLRSDRQVKNAALDFYWDRDLAFIKQDAIDGKLNKILMLKLLTSYTCNATCVSCNSSASSSWSNLEQVMYPTSTKRKYQFVDLEKVKQKVDFGELKMLSLIGGEPLYEKKNLDLLEYLIELGNTNVFLSLVTNGSVKLTKRHKEVLSKFKNINFSLSIDGTESVFEYMRYPLKWKDLLKNILFFKEISNNISSNYTLSNLNILYHQQTTQWFKENSMVFSINPVYYPSWLQPRALPEAIKKILRSKMVPEEYNTFIGPIHTQQDQQNYQTMLQQIKLQDSAKKIQIKNYLPELTTLLKNHGM